MTVIKKYKSLKKTEQCPLKKTSPGKKERGNKRLTYNY